MEKLIELLKESGKADEICPTWIDIRKQYFDAGNITRADRMMYEYLCSKHFWFIKWLVENDKIDYKKLKEGREDLCDVNLRHLRNKYINVVSLSYVKLLMLLAISDEPIEFLIDVLK